MAVQAAKTLGVLEAAVVVQKQDSFLLLSHSAPGSLRGLLWGRWQRALLWRGLWLFDATCSGCSGCVGSMRRQLRRVVRGSC